MSYENLYQKHLLEHYNHPKHRGVIENPDFSSGVFNPSCGDQVAIQAKILDSKIVSCKFEGKGCVISLASASFLTDWVHGKTLQEAQGFSSQDMLNLVQLQLGPNRVRCALLALEALHSGIKGYAKK
jgi:nitrogen fixation protein NifU and related proteins